MSIAELLKRALVRRVVYLLVAVLLGWFAGGGQAKAANTSGACPQTAPCEMPVAYSKCQEIIEYQVSLGGWYGDPAKHRCRLSSNPKAYIHDKYSSSGWNLGIGGDVFYFIDCPAGTEWFESLGQCDKPCSARNADLGSEESRPLRWSNSGDNQCIAECTYSIISSYQTRAITVTLAGQQAHVGGQVHGGIWGYTGARCPSPQSLPIDVPQKSEPACTPSTDGQTFCTLSNGNNCYTSSSGRMICWAPSEQGTKTDGPVTQTNNNGNQTPNPPDGSSHTSTVTTTTTTNTNVSNTTINNYTTNNGAPAGPTNQGTNVGSDGKPTGTGSTPGNGTGGEGDEDGNESSGGGDCAAPPVSSGDALLAQIAHQTWSTRCAISQRNKQQDDQANDLAGQGDGLDGISVEDAFADPVDIGDINENLIGSAGGQCSFGVPLEILGKPITLPPSFWSLLSWVGMLIVASAYLWVAQQLGG